MMQWSTVVIFRGNCLKVNLRADTIQFVKLPVVTVLCVIVLFIMNFSLFVNILYASLINDSRHSCGQMFLLLLCFPFYYEMET